MKIQSFTKRAVAAVLLAGVAFGANAATYNLDDPVVGSPVAFNAAVLPAGPFNDIFTFTLPANGGSGYSVIAFDIPPYFVSVLQTVSLVSNIDGTLFNADDHNIASAVSSDDKSLSLTWGGLAAGSYYLNVTGIATGTLGGAYNGAISVAAPIPEPESYAMFLAGLGIMGAIIRRRSRR